MQKPASFPSRVSLAASALALAALLAAPAAHAAAYYVGEIGARSIARGGANLVAPADPTAAWLNPAALSLAKGVQLTVDLNLVFLESSFTRDCGGKPNGCAPPADLHRTYTGTDGSKHVYDVHANRPAPDADTNEPGPADVNALGNFDTPSRFDGKTAVSNRALVQPVPRIMLSINGDTFGVDGVALGAYVFAPSNGDYDFGTDTPTRYTLIDRDLLEVYYGLALAYRYGDVIGVGAGLQFVTAGVNQRVALSADQYSNEDPDYDLRIKVDVRQDFIPSGNFGVWTNPGKLLGIGDLMLAGSVQLGRTVKATGPVSIDAIGKRFQAEFIDTNLITLDVAKDATATTEFQLAPFYRVGAQYGLDLGGGTSFNVEGDFVYEQWSVYDHVFLATKGVTVDTNPNDAVPAKELDPVVQPKDWVDAWSARFGGTLGLFDKMLELHAGGFYETSGIPNATYSVELADGDKVGVGAGVSGTMFGARVDVGYSHVFIFDRTVGNESIVYNGTAGPSILMGGADTETRVAMGKYSAGFDMVNVGVTVAFDEMFGFGAHAGGRG